MATLIRLRIAPAVRFGSIYSIGFFHMSQKVSFLLGSGVSIPAKMPSVKEITERVLSGAGVRRHTAGNYDFGQPLYAHTGFPDEYVLRVVAFLKRPSVEIEQYYSSAHDRPASEPDEQPRGKSLGFVWKSLAVVARGLSAALDVVANNVQCRVTR